MIRVYSDYAATTPADPRVVDAMLPYFTKIYGNPSSIHSFGREAKQAIDHARETVAAFIGANPEEIVFTSGGTESDNMAVKGLAYAARKRGNHIITTKIEHHAVLEPCAFLEKEGFKVTYIGVDSNGLVDPDDVRRAITDKTILISVMHANNEIGTIQPISEIAEIARSRGVKMHTDAVQTVAHIDVNVDRLGVDMLSASAHKFYGPKGIGFLYVRKGTKLQPFMQGGDQERKRRASTENLPGIVGMARAIELAKETMAEEARQQEQMRDRLITGIMQRISNVRLNGHSERRLPNNVNVSIEFVEGESLLLNMDMMGIACSTGSACSSSSLEPSHVLLAIGLPHEIAHGSLRFSFGRFSTEEDVDRILEVLPNVVEKLRIMSPLYNG